MDKIIEALSKLLPEDQITEVADAIKAELETAKQGLEKEYNSKLEEAYAELSEELKQSESTAYKGYEEAHAIIVDLRNRLDMLQNESKAEMDEGFEEAYQMLQAEREKNANLENELYEQFNQKLAEMREYFIDKIHQFMEYKGQEMYESVRREVMNDPRMVEHKLTLDRIVDSVADYLSEEDYNTACSRKLEEASKQLEEMKAQMRIAEARNIRLGNENTKLNTKLTEAVREKEQVLAESTKVEKKERAEKAANATGKGRAVEPEAVVVEQTEPEAKTQKVEADTNLTENSGASLEEWRVLAGTAKPQS